MFSEKAKRAKKEKIQLPPQFPPYTWNGKSGVLIVDEVRSPDLLLGKSDFARLVYRALNEVGIDAEEEAYYTAMYEGKVSTNAAERNAAYTGLRELINILKPRAIITLGEIAFEAVIGPKLTGRITGISWESFCGETIPDQESKIWHCPTWNASELLSVKEYSDGNKSKPLYQRDPSVYKLWQRHLERAFEVVKTTFPIDPADKRCFNLYSEEEAIDAIQEAMSWEAVAFDYETTGIKPFRKGHRILAISISNGTLSYAFPAFTSPRFMAQWRAFLVSSTKKISHNLQFEALWSYQIYGVWPKNWLWDTMIAQHCLANTKPSQLKFCVYAEFGVVGYDATADAYISSIEEERKQYGTNAFNTLDQLDLPSLLTYNAKDSFYTARLYKIQKAIISGASFDFMKGIAFSIETAIHFAKITQRGIRVDVEGFYRARDTLRQKLDEISAEIMASPEVQRWDREEAFNFNSAPQLSHLLFDVLGIKPISFTEKNAPSVDKINLPKYKLAFVEKILQYRKYAKILDTYIAQYLREIVDGRINPHFHNHRVDTHRTSSSDPNAQQSPKRDPEAKKYIREYILPDPGCKIIEYDYKQLEVCIAACHNKDPSLIKYVTDPAADMHRDSAMDVYILPQDRITPEIRSSVKGTFVFAEFYGSYYAKIAVDLWEQVKSLGLREHLAEQGILTYKDYEKYIERMEKRFWLERFPVYNMWRKEQYQFYTSHGYVDQFTGFRCFGPMSRNNTFNSPPQGDAAHVLLWAMNRVDEELEDRGMKSRVILEIHDSMSINTYPEEEAVVDSLVKYYCTEVVRKYWSWIVVPLQVEKEATDVDMPWATAHKAKFLEAV